MSIEVKVNRMHRFEDNEKNIKAFADIEINSSLLIKGLTVRNGSKGIFVSMPRQKGKDNKWYETVRALSTEVKDQIVSIVLEAYENEKI